jgi:putative ABC transport system permease protein
MTPRLAIQRLLALGRRRRLDAELEGEIAAHLELAERDLVASGLSPAEARRVARQRFGGVEPIKEAHRDSRSARWLEIWWQDLRLGLRGLRRAPGFCAAAVLVLGLSIGANTTMFSAVRAILLQPLAYADPDRLVVVLHDGRFPVAPANFLDWRAQTRSFEAMGAAEWWSPNLGLATGAERIKALRVSPETLRLLGVAPIAGRLLADGAAEGAERRTVVLGHGLWQRQFGGAPDVVGRAVRLDGEPYTVVGVMPPDFAFAPFWATEAQLWAPLPLDGRRDSRGGNSLRVFARLAPGVDAAAAQADVDLVTARLEQAFPGTNRGVQVVPLKERVVGHTRLGLTVLLVAVGFVLLIACANVAHMLLARAASRQSEIAVRLALGATRLQIVRQLLTESLLLAALSSLVGLAIAAGGVQVIAATAPPDLPRAADMAIEGWTLAFTLGLTVLTAIVFGLVPAWQAARTRIGDRLAARGASGHRREAVVRDLLVVSELALALVLLIGAGLTLRSLAASTAIDPGFEPRGVLSMAVSVQGTSAAAPGQRVLFFPAALDALRQVPGVEAASAVNHAPLVGDLWTLGFDIAGRTRAPGEDRPGAVYRVVLPGYFSTLRLPIVHGRDVSPADTHQAPDVVVVSETLVRRHFPAGDAVGQRITLDDPTAPSPRWLTIVGVVRDAVGSTWEGGADPTIYLPFLQTEAYLDGPEGRHAYLTVVLRTTGEPASVAAPARQAIWNVHPGASISETTTLSAAVDRALARPRFQSALLGAFAALALILAAAGIYGVMSYAVARRTREIGLRLTLGARRGDVLRLILSQAAVRLAVGGALGLAGAWLAAHALTSLLYGVRPTDPLTFAVVPAVLALTALAASYVPARRASRVDPMVALRIDAP